MGNDKTISGSTPSSNPPAALVLEPIVITAGEPIPEVKVASTPGPAISTEEFKKLTEEVKSLGVKMEGLVDEKGNLRPDQTESAKVRIKTRAQELEKEGNLTGAARLYKKTFQLDSHDIGARCDAARVLRQSAEKANKADLKVFQNEESRKELDGVLSGLKTQVNALKELISLGQWKEARTLAVQIRREYFGALNAPQREMLGSSSSYQSLLGQAHFLNGRALEGLKDLSQAAKSYRQALASAKQALQQDSKNPAAYFLNAQVQAGLGSYKAAVAAADKARELSPSFSETVLNFKEQLVRFAARSTVASQNALTAGDLPKAHALLAEVLKIYEALGDAKAVQTLSEKLEPLTKKINLNGMSEAARKLAEQGHLSDEILKKQNPKLNTLVLIEGGQLHFEEKFEKLLPTEKLVVLKELSRVGLSRQALALAEREKDPAKKLYYLSKADLLEGNVNAAKAKWVEFKAKTQGSTDSEILKMREDVGGLLRKSSLEAVERLAERNEALRAQRLGRVEAKGFSRETAELNGQVLSQVKTFLLQGRADTLEEGIALLQSEHKSLGQKFEENPVVAKNWRVQLPYRRPKTGSVSEKKEDAAGQDFIRIYKGNSADSRLIDLKAFAGLPSVKLQGGALEVKNPPKVLRIVIGKEGGTVQTVNQATLTFPPSDRERVVVLRYGGLEAPHLKEFKDYRAYPSSTEPAGFANLKKSDAARGHPDSYTSLVEHWKNMDIRDGDFLTLFRLETSGDWEKMKTPEGERSHLLRVAEQVRHRNGSYVVVGEILEKLFAKDFSKARAEISPEQRKQIDQEITKERPKIEKEVKKSLNKLKSQNSAEWSRRYPQGGPTAEEMKSLVDGAVQAKKDLKERRLVFEKLDSLHKKDGLSDPISDKAWKVYEDMKDPLDKFWNISDEGWDAIVDEAVIAAVTMPVTMGVGSAVRGGLGGTSLALRFSAQGGAKAFVAKRVVFGAGAIAEGYVMEAGHAALTAGDFQLKNAGFNTLMSHAFHGGGAIWGRIAQRAGVDQPLLQSAKAMMKEGLSLEQAAANLSKVSGRSTAEATAALERIAGKNLAGREALNFTGMMGTQTSVATAMGYAHSLDDSGPPRTFWERLGGEALRMVSFHYGTMAMNRVTGQVLTQKEMLVEGRQRVARENYEALQERYLKELSEQGYSGKELTAKAKDKALTEAVNRARMDGLGSILPPLQLSEIESPEMQKAREISDPVVAGVSREGQALRQAERQKLKEAQDLSDGAVSGARRDASRAQARAAFVGEYPSLPSAVPTLVPKKLSASEAAAQVKGFEAGDFVIPRKKGEGAFEYGLYSKDGKLKQLVEPSVSELYLKWLGQKTKPQAKENVVTSDQVVGSRQELVAGQARRALQISIRFGQENNPSFQREMARLIVEDIHLAEGRGPQENSAGWVKARVQKYLERAPESLKGDPKFMREITRLVEENLRGAQGGFQKTGASTSSSSAGIEKSPAKAPVLEGENSLVFVSYGAEGKRDLSIVQVNGEHLVFGKQEAVHRKMGKGDVSGEGSHHYVSFDPKAPVKIYRDSGKGLKEVDSARGKKGYEAEGAVRPHQIESGKVRFELREGDVLQVGRELLVFRTPEGLSSEAAGGPSAKSLSALRARLSLTATERPLERKGAGEPEKGFGPESVGTPRTAAAKLGAKKKSGSGEEKTIVDDKGTIPEAKASEIQSRHLRREMESALRDFVTPFNIAAVKVHGREKGFGKAIMEGAGEVPLKEPLLDAVIRRPEKDPKGAEPLFNPQDFGVELYTGSEAGRRELIQFIQREFGGKALQRDGVSLLEVTHRGQTFGVEIKIAQGAAQAEPAGNFPSSPSDHRGTVVSIKPKRPVQTDSSALPLAASGTEKPSQPPEGSALSREKTVQISYDAPTVVGRETTAKISYDATTVHRPVSPKDLEASRGTEKTTVVKKSGGVQDAFLEIQAPGQRVMISRREKSGELILGREEGAVALFELSRGRQTFHLKPLEGVKGEAGPFILTQGGQKGPALSVGQQALLKPGELIVELGDRRISFQVPRL